jgi:hypothetical protein
LQDSDEVVAGLLELLEGEPSLALERAIKQCLHLAIDSGAEVSMHRVAVVCITVAQRCMSSAQPQLESMQRAELCLRLLAIFTEMKPDVCCDHLEELLRIRSCVMRVNHEGGTKGVLLQNALLKIIMLMAGDPACQAEVNSAEIFTRPSGFF